LHRCAGPRSVAGRQRGCRTHETHPSDDDPNSAATRQGPWSGPRRLRCRGGGRRSC
jgi:hypothetical protein